MVDLVALHDLKEDMIINFPGDPDIRHQHIWTKAVIIRYNGNGVFTVIKNRDGGFDGKWWHNLQEQFSSIAPMTARDGQFRFSINRDHASTLQLYWKLV